MSKKTVLAFIQQVLLNPELQNQVEGAGDFAHLQKIATSAGYPFNEQEWNTASLDAFNGLLSEEDLQEINAGFAAPSLASTGMMGMTGTGMTGFAGKTGSLTEGQSLIKFVPK